MRTTLAHSVKEVVKTEKWWIHYKDGSRSLDLETSQSAYTLGFSNPEIIQSMYDQMSSVSRIIPYWLETTKEIQECKNFILSTGNWSKLNWSTSGTSAVECAILMCDEYWASLGSKKTKLLSYAPVWHGTTYITRSLNNVKQNVLNSSRIINVDTPNWLKYEDREVEELRALKETEEHFKSGDVSGVIFNPVAWFNGIMPFSKYFWKSLRELCDKYDVLMIVDDITACWGKVGTWHSFTGIGDNVQPDISAMGKSIGAGHAPIGVTVCNKRVAEKTMHMQYGHTWTPYMAAIAAINKTTEIIKRDVLLEKSKEIEIKNKNLCEFLSDKIASYRTCGAFLAIDLKNEIPKERYTFRGLSTKHRKNVIKITVPLIADDEYYHELQKKLVFIL